MSNVRVAVRDGDVAHALRRFKKKCEQNGVFSEIKRLECYTPPGQKRRVEHRRVLSRQRRMEKKAL